MILVLSFLSAKKALQKRSREKGRREGKGREGGGPEEGGRRVWIRREGDLFVIYNIDYIMLEVKRDI